MMNLGTEQLSYFRDYRLVMDIVIGRCPTVIDACSMSSTIHTVTILRWRARNKASYSLVPRPPFNTAREKGGLVNIAQHFCRAGGTLAGQSDWLMWQLSHLYWASLQQTT